MTVVFKELAGSPKETFNKDGMKAVRQFLVDWDDRYTFMEELLGTGEEFGHQAPVEYPDHESVFAKEIKIEPFGSATPDEVAEFNDAATNINEYTGKVAKIVVNYETVLTALPDDAPDTEPGTFLTYSLDFSGEYMTLPIGQVRWESSDTLPVDEEVFPNIRIPIVEHHLKWHRVINPPWTAIRESTGCVNNAAFMGAAAQTVLFDGVQATKEFIYFDDFMNPLFGWEIDYLFREKSIKYLNYGGNEAVAGWCHSFRTATSDAEPELAQPGWDRLIWGPVATPNYLYREKAFGPLFLFSAVAE